MKLICELIVTPIDNEFVAVPMTERKDLFRGIVHLNETGAMIVNCLTEGKDVDEIAEQILVEYENVTQETAKEAVQSVVDKLRAVGLIEE